MTATVVSVLARLAGGDVGGEVIVSAEVMVLFFLGERGMGNQCAVEEEEEEEGHTGLVLSVSAGISWAVEMASKWEWR
jgi:hypothetical protein